MSEIHSEGEMTFDQAAQAVSEAVAADPEFTPGAPDPLPVTPPAEAPAADQAQEPTPPATPAPEAATDFSTSTDETVDLFEGGPVNPDLLPDELKPLAKQLQGSYTQKTQELAERRKAVEALEGLGDPEELRMAHEFYSSLRDPEYLKNFYQELGNVVREQGLLGDEGAAPADAQPAVVEPPQVDPELSQLAQTDPELAPFVDKFSAMEQRLAQFEAQAAQERQALTEERQLMAEAAQIDQQVQAVREAHPDYGDADWQAVYDFAIANDGDVTLGAQAYEANRARIIESWTSQKQAMPAAQPSGAGTVTEAVEEDLSDLSPQEVMDRADRAAQAFLEQNDLQEFTG